VPNLTSHAVAVSVRRLYVDMEAYDHPVLPAETFVDLSRLGACATAPPLEAISPPAKAVLTKRPLQCGKRIGSRLQFAMGGMSFDFSLSN